MITQGIQPELLEPISPEQAELLIADPNYWLQLKADGERRMVSRPNGILYGFNRKGQVVNVEKTLSSELLQLPFEHFLADGEHLGDGDEKREIVLFDLLWADADLMQLPYYRRFEVLEKAVQSLSGDRVHLVPNYKDESSKRAALKRMEEANAEGVVFRRIDAPYVPDRRGPHMKLKFWSTCTAKVTETWVAGKESVKVSLLSGDKWQPFGRIAVAASKMPTPGDLVEVKYLYVGAHGRFYQADVLRVRDDVDESACSIQQLKPIRQMEVIA